MWPVDTCSDASFRAPGAAPVPNARSRSKPRELEQRLGLVAPGRRVVVLVGRHARLVARRAAPADPLVRARAGDPRDRARLRALDAVPEGPDRAPRDRRPDAGL